MSEYLTPVEVAAKLGVTPTSVRRWVLSGEMPGFKVGDRIFIPKNFEELLDAQQTQEVPDDKPPAA